jgi:hypothetical protein
VVPNENKGVCRHEGTKDCGLGDLTRLIHNHNVEMLFGQQR